MSEKNNWSHYWAQGHKTSFGDSFKDCYEGILKKEWLDVFSNLDNGDNVLDLCTGNGSLPRLAQGNLENFSKINFYGVDYAVMKKEDPFIALDNIKFTFDCNIESLPYADGEMDYIISNYGVEYSNLHKSIPEVSRVMKKSGRAVFICHCNSSRIYKENQTELTLLTFLLKQGGLIDVLGALIELLELKKMTSNEGALLRLSHEAEHYRNTLNSKLADALNEFGVSFHQSDFVHFMKYIMNKSISEKGDKFFAYREETVSHKSRLYALCSAAIKIEGLQDTIELFNTVDLKLLHKKIITDEKGIIAIKFDLQKY
ncbi:class I SAM-dependent methyltransferase [Colwellia sp. RSH04]|uniref:class I SAM-dependent methyltransferase n=1 Tax=Colwellia sp. RSH04 TaxID=2305464 RepID=UPI000E573A12|nr:class I SAM-dependent methyltransferase [Colwellia sp. RSH04]RHW75622.1 class I SAM-dependent methyltransferase [Colwellia sp. RSH04]